MDTPVLPESGRIMALDVGSKRTGVAMSDETRLIASPTATIEATDKGRWAKDVAALSLEWEVSAIVVGMPLNQHGEEGKDALFVRSYIDLLKKRVTVPVIEWDERFTTVQAERRLIEADMSRKNRKQVIDKVAAAIFLQSYLDSLRWSSTH